MPSQQWKLEINDFLSRSNEIHGYICSFFVMCLHSREDNIDLD